MSDPRTMLERGTEAVAVQVHIPHKPWLLEHAKQSKPQGAIGKASPHKIERGCDHEKTE